MNDPRFTGPCLICFVNGPEEGGGGGVVRGGVTEEGGGDRARQTVIRQTKMDIYISVRQSDQLENVY